METPGRVLLEGRVEAGGSNNQEVTGVLKMEQVRGRTVATRSFAKYPLKFMVPSRVAQHGVDAVWVYVITYGGGILAGDTVSFSAEVGPSCTGVLTTQASTKVYHSTEGQVAEQVVTASVGCGALLAVLPDPVTCFRDAKYVQKQTFCLTPGSSLVLVDWFTSGRRLRGEVWAFGSYSSSNRVLVAGKPPLLLDTVNLEQGEGLSVAQRMQGLHVVAMVLLYGPRARAARSSMESGVHSIAETTFKQNWRASEGATPGYGGSQQAGHQKAGGTDALFASCSGIGPQNEALLVRVAGTTTEGVYRFLRTYLAPLAGELGGAPYASLG